MIEIRWTFAPVVLLSIVAYGAIYFIRWRHVRASHGPAGAPAWRAAAFAGGLACLFAALISPVDHLGEQLASAHMVQHLLLADLAAIGMILGLTKLILRPVTRRVQRIERAAGPLAHPAAGVIGYVAVMWFWHIPPLYDAALEHAALHVLEHLCYLTAGFVYWWHLLSPIRSRLRLGGMGPIIYMASTKVLVGFLGILLAFAPELVLLAYEDGGTRWGMSPLDDQGVAGLIMGLEQSIVMGIGLAFLFARMLAESEREDQRAEALEERKALESQL